MPLVATGCLLCHSYGDHSILAMPLLVLAMAMGHSPNEPIAIASILTITPMIATTSVSDAIALCTCPTAPWAGDAIAHDVANGGAQQAVGGIAPWRSDHGEHSYAAMRASVIVYVTND